MNIEIANRIIAYVRVSTSKQTVENQENEINRYAVAGGLIIDEFIRIEVSSQKNDEDRKINLLIKKLNKGDTLIVSELSRLGRSTIGVLSTIDTILKKGCTIIFIKQGLTVSDNTKDATSKVMLTLFSLFAELERDLISNRTKEALGAKKGKGLLGRKEGSLSKSKYDKLDNEILNLLNKNVNHTAIVNTIGFGSAKTLIEWKKKRIEFNDLMGGFFFNDRYKNYLISVKKD